MKIYRNPSEWPKAGLLPALLLRLTRQAMEQRLGEKFTEFEDEGENCSGLAFTTDSGISGALLIREGQEFSPSLYLSVAVQQDCVKVDEVLRGLRLLRSEVIDSQSDTFSLSDINSGRHLIFSQ